MWTDVRAAWALFIGVGFIMIGNGLQGTLLGLRASLEGFSTFTTGIMMSGYFVGILLGSILAPRLVSRVGHIRVFGALASAASISILVHGLLVNPATWFMMRLVTGISYAGLYVVSESWLNDRASNETRGKMLSLYMVVTTLGMGAGQFLLNIADPLGIELFVLVSVVVSFGLIPMLLTARPAPAFETTTKMTLGELFRASPLALISNMLTGMAHGTIFGLGAVYASQQGFSVDRVSLFMACILIGGLIFQWPLGWLSDRIERRKIISGVALVSCAMALVAVTLDSHSNAFLICIVVLGGTAMPLYSLCVAYANDRLEPEQIVAASGSLVMVAGIGLTTGPILISLLMNEFGAVFYFYGLSVVFSLITLFTLYRMGRRAGIEVDQQAPIIAGQIGTPIAELVAPDAEDYVEAAQTGEWEKLDQENDASEDVDRRL
ncbi:MAG: MFS transporter [Pseudomonadota bacterium]